MMEKFDIWLFVAGIALFIFSMSWIEESLRKIAGRSFKKYLQRQTSKPVRAIIGGTVVTGVLQSSSVVLLMVLSFVGAGIISMRNALAVVLGSNFGTTLDSWLVALLGFKTEISRLTFPVLGIAVLAYLFFGSNKKIFWLTRFLCGFALLFTGLEWMKESVGGLVDYMDVSQLQNYSAYWSIPAGFIITAIIQSSSATIAITLTALYSNLIPMDHAAAIVVGAELGTSLKILLGAIGSTADKMRVAWGNFLFNTVTLITGAILLYPLLNVLDFVTGGKDQLIMLVLFQSSINLINIAIFFPFLKKFALYLESRFKSESDSTLTKYIHKVPVSFSEDVLEAAGRETIHLMNSALELNRIAFQLKQDVQVSHSWYGRIRGLATSDPDYLERYEHIKTLQGEILEFLVDVRQEEFSKEQLKSYGQLLSACREVIHGVKNIKDIIHNLEELKDTANDELFSHWTNLRNEVDEIYQLLGSLILHPSSERLQESLTQLLEKNRIAHKNGIGSVLSALKAERIQELEASTLLNVHQKIFSSNQALITAAMDLPLNEKV